MVTATCTHHWLVDPPSGGLTSHGVCKLCGEERDFPNVLEDVILKDADFQDGTPIAARLVGQPLGKPRKAHAHPYKEHQKPRYGEFPREAPVPPESEHKETTVGLRGRPLAEVMEVLNRNKTIGPAATELGVQYWTLRTYLKGKGVPVEDYTEKGKRTKQKEKVAFRQPTNHDDLSQAVAALGQKVDNLVAELTKPHFTATWGDGRLIFTCPTQEDCDRVTAALRWPDGILVRVRE